MAKKSIIAAAVLVGVLTSVTTGVVVLCKTEKENQAQIQAGAAGNGSRGDLGWVGNEGILPADAGTALEVGDDDVVDCEAFPDDPECQIEEPEDEGVIEEPEEPEWSQYDQDVLAYTNRLRQEPSTLVDDALSKMNAEYWSESPGSDLIDQLKNAFPIAPLELDYDLTEEACLAIANMEQVEDIPDTKVVAAIDGPYTAPKKEKKKSSGWASLVSTVNNH